MEGEKAIGPAWAPWTSVLLGAWLLSSPATLGYGGAEAWSDWISGAAAVVFGLASASPRHAWWAVWSMFLVGFWLLFAPLILWAGHAAAYLNSTAVGILLIATSLVLPRQLGSQEVAPDTPPGWSFNPSSWTQRFPIIALAWLNFFLARYMAAYHLGHIDTVWDPFFGDGTVRVLESEVSEAFPISDAGLGAVAYALEALIGYMATTSRWRAAPWVVALFGVLVVPVGIVSIVLIILQPVAVGYWCTICLVTAASMLVMAVLALPEVAAMGGYLVRARRAGRSAWWTFWRGGPDADGVMEPDPVALTDPPRRVLPAMVRGVTAPWNLTLCIVLGVWLMFAPPLLEIEGPAADAHFIAGALIITVTALAMAEIARAARFANVLLGVCVIAAPWILAGATGTGRANAALAGIVLILLSLRRGPIRQRYGEGEKWIV